MKMIVLAGGLSTERDVSLSASAGICRTLLEKGHGAFLLDVFMGFPYDKDRLEEVFTLPDHGLDIVKNISEEEPDLAAVKASRPDQSDCFLGPNVIELCRMADITFLGLHGGEGARVGGEVEDGVLTVQDEAAQDFEIRAHAVPVADHALGQGTDGFKVGDAADGFADPSGKAVGRAQAGDDRAVPGGDERLLKAGALLQHHLGEPLRVVEVGVGEDFGHEREQVVGLVRRGLAAEAELGDGHPGAAHGGDEGRGVHAAGLGGQQGAELHEIAPGRAHFRKAAAHERDEGQEFGGHGVQREEDFRIQDAGRVDVVGEDGQIARPAFFLGQAYVLAGQIRKGQARYGGEGFGAVRGLLAGAQGFGAGVKFIQLAGNACIVAFRRLILALLVPHRILCAAD